MKLRPRSAVTALAAVALGLSSLTVAAGGPVAAADKVDKTGKAEKAEKRPTANVFGWNASKSAMTVGDRFVERVRVTPKAPRRKYQVQWRRDGKAWHTRQSGRAKRSGRVTVRYRPPGAGRYAVKIVVPGDKTARRKVTAVHRIRVARPQRAPQPVPAPIPVPTASPAPTVAPPPPAPPLPRLQPDVPAGTPFTAYTVGDMGWCDEKENPDIANQMATSKLIPDGGMLLGLGDQAQNDGGAVNFADCYLPAYGRLLDTTYPVPGNHEYIDPNVAYFDVFGDRVGTRQTPWYGFQRGSWSFYQLNSACSALGGCDVTSAQYQWFAAQLAVDTNRCIALSWHHPRWAATYHGPYNRMEDFYRLAAASGVDIVLSGHEHMYQRFPRLDADGRASAAGPRQFIVGTGGMRLGERKMEWPQLPEAYKNGSFGVMRLNLFADGFQWQFKTISGGTPDHGSDTCGSPVGQQL